MALPNGNTLASKTEDELIAIGKGPPRPASDKIKQDFTDKRAAPDLQAEYMTRSTPPPTNPLQHRAPRKVTRG